MIELENIAALKLYTTPDMAASPPTPPTGLTVYINGHTTRNDGGGGIFQWSRDPNYIAMPDNNGTIIDPAATNIYNGQGRWVRQIDGHISVRYFGAFGNEWAYIDETDRIQAAIDFAASNVRENWLTHGNEVYLPSGYYYVTHLELKNGIAFKGDFSYNTVISNWEPEVLVHDYLITTEKAPTRIRMENITFEGKCVKEDPSRKGCLFFDSEGIWNSNFKDIAIYNFNGHCIYLKGGGLEDVNYKVTNQFTVFENVRAIRNGVKDKHTLFIDGSAGQLTFLNCNFDAKTRMWETPPVYENVLAGTNVYIKGYPIDKKGNKVYHYPAVLQFLTSTFQLSEYAVKVEGCDSVTFDTCWLENNEVSIDIVNSRSINILNSRFTYASSWTETIPQGTGRCIATRNSQVNVQNNLVIDPRGNPQGYLANTFLSVDSPERLGTNMSGNYYETNRLGFTYGVLADPGFISGVEYNIQLQAGPTVYYTQPTAGGTTFSITNFIDMGGNKAAYVIGNDKPIKVITSAVNAGEYLYIRAKDKAITFDETGNIFLSFKKTLTINPGECALFIRVDTFVINPTSASDGNTNVGVEFRENYNLVSIATYNSQ